MTQFGIKYRPDNFDDIVGNRTAVKQLQKLINADSAKAILLHGPSGSGKTTLAKIVATQLTEYDTDIVEHNIGDKGGIDDIRNLINQAKFSPRGEHKVFILDEAHALTIQAKNALLTPLENPKTKVVWILCTDAPHSLNKQILNRVIPIKLEPPTTEELKALLLYIAKKEKATELLKNKDRDTILEKIIRNNGNIPRAVVSAMQAYLSTEVVDSPINIDDDVSLDETALRVIMCLYSTERRRDVKIRSLISTVSKKDMVGILNKIQFIHLMLIENLAGCGQPVSFYFLKELKPTDSVAELDVLVANLSKLAKLNDKTKWGNNPSYLILTALLSMVV